jgi:hypothetical protein
MKKAMGIKTMLVGTFLITVSLIVPSQAFAWGWGRPQRDYPHYRNYPYGSVSVALPNGFISIGFGGKKFFYAGGLFYQQYQREYIVVPPPDGAVVYAVPNGYSKVVIDGVVYYAYNGVYYSRVQQGYQVVQPPSTVVLEPATVTANIVPEQGQGEFTVNIPNTKGGYNGVILKRSGNGFIGPQGEYYAEFPKVEQLKVMYGK